MRVRPSTMSCCHSSKVRTPFFFAREREVRNVPITMTGDAAAIISITGRLKTSAIVTPRITGITADSHGSGVLSASSGRSPGSSTTGGALTGEMREVRLKPRMPTSSGAVSASLHGARPMRTTELPSCTTSAGTTRPC
jgi:hypothetical protein